MTFELITSSCERDLASESCKKDLSKHKENIRLYQELLQAAKDAPDEIINGEFYRLFALSIEERTTIFTTLLEHHPVEYITWQRAQSSSEYMNVLKNLSEQKLFQDTSDNHYRYFIFRSFRLLENFPWGKGFIQKMIETYPENLPGNIRNLRYLKNGLEYIQFIGEKHPNIFIIDIERFDTNDEATRATITKILISNPNINPKVILDQSEYLIKNGFQESLKTYLISRKDLMDFVEDSGYGLKISLDLWKGEPWAKDIILALINRNTHFDPDNFRTTLFESKNGKDYMSAYVEKTSANAIYFLKEYKKYDWAEDILTKSMKEDPLRGFSYYPEYKDLPYGNKIFEALVESDPYNGLIYLYERMKDKTLYLKHIPMMLSNIQARCNHDLEKSPQEKSLYVARIVNMLHDEAPEMRFAVLKGLKPENLYRLMVYGRSEIFTSTYSGIFDRIQSSPMRIHEILRSVNYEGIHTFFESVSSYGDVSKILNETPSRELEHILDVLFSDLSTQNNGRNSIALIDIIMKIQDHNLLQKIQQRMQDKIAQVDGNTEWRIIGKYLSKNKEAFNLPIFTDIDPKYELPNLSRIQSSHMFSKDIDPQTGKAQQINTQQYYFYNDKDGIHSYKNFLNTYKTWGIEDKGVYVILSKSGKNGTIKIYANKPESERDGIDALKEMSIKPSIVVHRGHSYHAPKTIRDMSDAPKMVFLGSCGGFQNIGEVIRKSPNAHIISTKGIGTMLVNDPLFESINSDLLGQDEISWEKIWGTVTPKIHASTFKDLKENFEKYMRPDKNLGTLFLQRIESLRRDQNP